MILQIHTLAESFRQHAIITTGYEVQLHLRGRSRKTFLEVDEGESDIIVIRRHVNYACGYKCQYDRQSAVASAALTRRPVKVKSLVCLNQCARKRPSYLCPVITRTLSCLSLSHLCAAHRLALILHSGGSDSQASRLY